MSLQRISDKNQDVSRTSNSEMERWDDTRNIVRWWEPVRVRIDVQNLIGLDRFLPFYDITEFHHLSPNQSTSNLPPNGKPIYATNLPNFGRPERKELSAGFGNWRSGRQSCAHNPVFYNPASSFAFAACIAPGIGNLGKFQHQWRAVYAGPQGEDDIKSVKLGAACLSPYSDFKL